MKKLVLFLGVVAAAAVLAVPAALAKEIGSGGIVTPPTPAPVTTPCATVTSVSVLGKKAGGEPAFGFQVSGDYAVTSCSTLPETVVVHVNFSKWGTGELLQSYDAETTPLLAGKPPQHRSVRRGRNALTPAAVSRAQGRPTSPIPRAVATEDKVVAGRIDVASASLASSPEVEQKQRLVPEVADLEDILAERDACGVSVCFYLFFCLCSWIGIGDWPRR